MDDKVIYDCTTGDVRTEPLTVEEQTERDALAAAALLKQEEHDADVARREFLRQAVTTLRQWADDAEATTVTSGNAVAVLGQVVTRLGVFFDHFADLIVTEYGQD